MNQSVASKIYALAMFLAVSVVCGLLTAGLLVPYIALSGGVAKAGAASLNDLPTALDIPAQSVNSKVLLADGSVLGTFYAQNRQYVTLKQISKPMQQAQVAIEDHRFYEHGAIDIQGTLRAFIRNAAGGATQGGSTLTQQYIKQVLVQDAALNGDEEGVKEAQAPTISRKVRELRYAIALEKKYTKDQILERYLNIAYYADGAYGVEAAAKHYFNTTAAKLNYSQSAFLAGLVQNPTGTDPARFPDAAVTRRNVVLNRMAQLNVITEQQATEAKQVGFSTKQIQALPNGCVDSKYPIICQYVMNVLIQDTTSLGKTTEERENLIKRGGLTIQLSLDPKIQSQVQKDVNKIVSPEDPVIGSAVILEPKTGHIVAMAQSRHVMGSDKKKGETWINYNVPRHLGGGDGFQAGSTFKMFGVAAALNKGWTQNKQYDAPRTMDFTDDWFSSCEGPFKPGTWKVSNSTAANGQMNMVRAAQGSVNTYFVQLERDTGVCETTKMAEALGIELGDGKSPVSMSNIASFILGAVEVTPMSVAEAYATIANQGVHCDPTIITSITGKNNQGKATKYEPPASNCKRVISADVANGVTNVLKQVMVYPGTGVRAAIPGIQYQAGKTGTTDSNQAVWFAGYTPELAGISMISVAKGETKLKSLKYLRLKTGVYLEGSGSGDAGRIYRQAMKHAMEGRPDRAFTKPSQEVLNGKMATVPNTSGMSLSQAKVTISKVGYGTITQQQYDNRPAGSFIGTFPAGGSRARLGQPVYLYISAGPKPVAKPADPGKGSGNDPGKGDDDKKTEPSASATTKEPGKGGKKP